MILQLFSILLLFSNFAFAEERDLNLALKHFKSGDYQSSKIKFIHLIKSDKGNPLYWFNLGHVYLKLNDPQKAIKCYERVVHLKSPLSPAAKYFQAKALIENGQFQEAKGRLETLLAHKELPDNLQQNTKDLLVFLSSPSGMEELALKKYQEGNYQASFFLLQSIPKGKLSEDGHILLLMVYARMNNFKEFQKLKRDFFRLPTVSSAKRALVLDLEKMFPTGPAVTAPLTLFLDISGGTNSNVYADGDSVEPLESVEYRLFTGGSYQWGLGTGNFVRAAYTFSKNWFVEAPELEASTHNARISYLSLNGKRTFELTPYYQLQNWDGVNVSNRIGGMSLISYSHGSGEYGFIFDISKRSSLEETYSYLDSMNGSTRAFISWWTSSFLFELNFSGGYDGTKDIVYSDGGRLPLTHFYYGPGIRSIFRPNDSLVFTGLTSYLLREYQNTSIPGEKRRSDQEFSYSLRINFYFIPSTSIYLQHEGLSNKSSLGSDDVRDKNYQVQTQSVGLTWDYL